MRTGADILRISGVDELIVYDIDAYIKKAIELATNREKWIVLMKKFFTDKLTETKIFVNDFYKQLETI